MVTNIENTRKRIDSAGSVAQAIGHLPSKCKSLRSNPSKTKKNKNDKWTCTKLKHFCTSKETIMPSTCGSRL
jgi:hypothetical protein